MLTREEMRQILAGTGARRRGDTAGVPPEISLTAAAVLVPILERPAGLTVLLTRRADHLADHAGQISFPGGRLEPGDPDPEYAALREAEEEVGLPRAQVSVLGRLDEYVTGTGFRVTPVVGMVAPPFEPRIFAAEVAEAFEAPLAYLIDPANRRRDSRQFGSRIRYFDAIPFGSYYIWGATAGMLVNLAELLWPAVPTGR